MNSCRASMAWPRRLPRVENGCLCWSFVDVVALQRHRMARGIAVRGRRRVGWSLSSCRNLPRTSARPLAGDDDSVVEDLSTPDAPRLAAVECGGQALLA